MRQDTQDTINGWGAVFRLVTPALLSVLIWIVTSGNSHRDALLDRISLRLDVLSNDYLHALGDIKERLGRIEARNTVMNNVKKP